MVNFLNDELFLDTNAARRLWTEYASALPIFDYHCHLSPATIAEDRPLTDLADIWLSGDHYKWRVMRADGAPEELCSGKGDPGDKLKAYARALTRAAGNPLVLWTHLELKRAYGIEETLTPESALRIRERANAVMRERGDTPRRLMERFGVAVVCTTDDPADDLAAHKRLASDPTVATRVLPAMRPDRLLSTADPAAWRGYAARLGQAADVEIRRWKDLAEALDRPHPSSHEAGCRPSDHAILVPSWAPAAEAELDAVVASLLAGKALDALGAARLRTAVLLEAAALDAKRGWAMQLHVGALRDVRGRLFASYGPDGGGDTISDEAIVAPLASFLDTLDRGGRLPRSILYSLDPSRNEALSVLAGSFCGSPDGAPTVPGQVQFGAAWWFNDHKAGVLRHMEALAATGLLGRWLGMLTDSRSFLSYPRHEYFRRLLCGYLGRQIESGELPDDDAYAGSLVRSVSWGNAASWFGIEPPDWALDRAARIVPLL